MGQQRGCVDLGGAALHNGADINIAHRWTLEELWSFVLKLDRLEDMLGVAPKARPTAALPETEAAIPDAEAIEAAPSEAIAAPAAALEVQPAWEASLAVAASEEAAPEDAATEEAAPALEAESSKKAHAEQELSLTAISEREKKPRKKKISGLDVFLIAASVLTLIALLWLVTQPM